MTTVILTKVPGLQCGHDATLHAPQCGPNTYYFPASELPQGQEICAVLAVARSGHGAVRVVGPPAEGSNDVRNDENIVTHPWRREEYYLLLVQSNQKCAVLGASSYRLVSRPPVRN